MDTLTVATQHFAEALQEPHVPLFWRVLGHLSPERVATIPAETLQYETNGGALTL